MENLALTVTTLTTDRSCPWKELHLHLVTPSQGHRKNNIRPYVSFRDIIAPAVSPGHQSRCLNIYIGLRKRSGKRPELCAATNYTGRKMCPKFFTKFLKLF